MNPSSRSPSIQRILVLRTGHIGDVVILSPCLELLNKLFPGAEISALVRAGTEPVLQHHPLIKRIYTGGEIVGQQRMLVQQKTSLWNRLRQVPRGLRVIREMRRQKFDLAVDFTGGDRTAFFAFLSGARLRVAYAAGKSGFVGRNRLFTHLCRTPLKLEHRVLKDVELLRTVARATGREGLMSQLTPGPTALHCSRDDLAWAQARWSSIASAGGPRVLVHPTSRVYYKCWAPEKWAAVIDRLISKNGSHVLVTSGPDARELEIARGLAALCRGEVHTQLGDLTLGRLAALIRGADLFLGVDTAPMHIAAAVGTRVVAVFGPSHHETWSPWGPGHQVVRRPCACLTLRKRVCSEAEGMDCLKALTADEVYGAASCILRESRDTPADVQPGATRSGDDSSPR